MQRKLKVVGVIGSNRDEWEEYAAPLGAALGLRGINLLTGGGRGVMTSVSRSFTRVAGREGFSIACVPTKKTEAGDYIFKDGYPNEYTEVSIVSPLGTFNPKSPDDINRNFINVMSSDLVIALPGRTGTRNEISLCQKFDKPVILHGPAQEWADLPGELVREENLDRVLTWLDRQLKLL